MNDFRYPPNSELVKQQDKMPLFLILMLALFAFDGVFSSLFESNVEDRIFVHLYRLGMIIFFVSYSHFVVPFTQRRFLFFEKVLWMFVAWAMISTILISSDKILSLKEVLRYVYWTTAFTFVYLLAYRYPSTAQYLSFFLIISTFYYFVDAYHKRNAMIDWRGDKPGGINVAYSFLCVYPWLFFQRRKLLQLLGLVVIFSGVAIGYKRGAVIGLFGALFFSGLCGTMIYREKKLIQWLVKMVLVSAILFLLGAVLFIFVRSGYEYRFLELDALVGRDDIYGSILAWQTRATWLEVFAGLGPSMTLSITDTVAHNDWLQCIVELGGVGVVIFILMHIGIIRVIWTQYRLRSEMLIPCISGYAIFWVRSMTGGWLHYTSFAYFLSLLALAYAWQYREYEKRVQ